jgi:hypothetical protein
MNISVSSQTTLNDPANYFIFALYDASAPTVLIEQVAPAKPYGNPLQITFLTNCQSGHIYIIKLWENTTAVVGGTVRNSFSQAVTATSILVRLPEYLEAGLTPGLDIDGTSYVDTTWSGWDYWIERVGQGTMTPDFTANSNPQYHKEDTGGFTLVQAGDKFGAAERFDVFFVPQSIPLDPGSASPVFSTGRIITADESLASGDIGQALIIQATANTIEIYLPPLTTVPDFSPVYLFSNGGNHVNAVIYAPGTDKIFLGADRDHIMLGQQEKSSFFKAFGKWYPNDDLEGQKKVGELIYDYGIAEVNTVPCNGTLLQRDVYRRLWEFVQSLGAGVVVSDSAWNSTMIDGVYTKKGCFSSGDGSTTFRVPLLTDMVMKGVDGTARVAGLFVRDQNLRHGHGIHTSNSGNSSNTNADPVRASGGGSINDRGSETDVTGGGDHTIATSGGDENLIRTTGTYILLRV